MFELFSGEETRVYFEKISKKIESEISSMTDEEITSCDFDEWSNYLYDKYEIDPIVIFEESTTNSIDKTTVKKYNHFYRDLPYQQEYYYVDGVRITYKIPYDGDSTLLYLRPSSRILTRFEVSSVNAPQGEECGTIEMVFDYSQKELQDKGEEMQSFVQGKFKNEFKNYKTMIAYVNSEVESYNNSLRKFCMNRLESRKQKASSFAMISQMLEIPLPKSANAPNTKPIRLERIKRTPTNRPSQKPLPSEYCISDENYDNINNIILMSGTTMEKTARTYFRNDEEELRDHLLTVLNTHYENATGETFRKIGKTDIHIEFDNKAAFIGECKIWHGEKVFSSAIQQVLNYSTWKDIKVSIIIFNKDNKSFKGIIDKINEWVMSNTKSYKKPKANVWDCVFYRNDMNTEIKLNILAFDLYVDETQFQS